MSKDKIKIKFTLQPKEEHLKALREILEVLRSWENEGRNKEKRRF